MSRRSIVFKIMPPTSSKLVHPDVSMMPIPAAYWKGYSDGWKDNRYIYVYCCRLTDVLLTPYIMSQRVSPRIVFHIHNLQAQKNLSVLHKGSKYSTIFKAYWYQAASLFNGPLIDQKDRWSISLMHEFWTVVFLHVAYYRTNTLSDIVTLIRCALILMPQ